MRVGLVASTLLCSGQEVKFLPVVWPGSVPRESGNENQTGGQGGGAHDGAGVGCRESHTMWCDTLLRAVMTPQDPHAKMTCPGGQFLCFH